MTVVLDARDRPVARKEALVRAHALGGLELVGGGVHGSLTAGAHLHMLIASFQAGHVATNDAAPLNCREMPGQKPTRVRRTPAPR